MRKKLFAILLSLCMVITMMPSMAMAGSGGSETEKLYFVYYNGTSKQELDKNYSTDRFSYSSENDKYKLGKGDTCEAGLGIRVKVNGDDTSTYKLISEDSVTVTTTNDNAESIDASSCVQFEETGEDDRAYYRISFTQSAVVGKIYTISYTESSTTYSIDVECTLPVIGAYRGSSATADALLNIDNIYEDLNGNTEFYLIAQMREGNEVADGYKLSVEKYNDGKSENERLYTITEDGNALKVTLQTGFDEARFMVKASKEGSNNWTKTEIYVAAPKLYTVDENDNKDVRTIGKNYTTTSAGSGTMSLGKGYSNYTAFGILQGEWKDGRGAENTFKIISKDDIEVTDSKGDSSNCIKFERDGRDGETGAYIISFTDDAEIGETYTLTYTEGSKSYSIRYKCVLPNIAAFTTYTAENGFSNLLLNDDNKVSYNDLAEVDDKEYRTIYFVANNTESEVKKITLSAVDGDELEWIGKATEEGETATAFHAASGETPAYLEVHVKSNIVSERCEVAIMVQGQGENLVQWDSSRFTIAGNVMYSVWPEDDCSAGGFVSESECDSNNEIWLTPGHFEYCNFGIQTVDEEKGNGYTIVEPYSENENYIKVDQEGNQYRISAGANAVPGTTYYICATYEDVVYRIPVNYNLPSIGAYTKYTDEMDSEDETKVIKREFPSRDLLANSENEISYNDLDPVENENYRIVYFVANTDSNATVTDITIEDGDSEYIDVPEDGYHAANADTRTPAYLEVHVSKDIVSEECRVSVMGKYREDGDEINLCDPVTFTISGNLMYALNIVQQSQIDAGDTIQCEYCDSQVWLTPNSERGYYFAVPVEGEDSDNLYRIVDNVTAPDGIEITSSENGFVNIKAKEGTELGTYYLTGTVTETTGTDAKTTTTTYKIPVEYELPTFGLYTDTTPNLGNFVSESEVYYGDLDDSGDKTVYLIVNTDGDVESLNFNVSYGGDAIEIGEFVSATEDTYAYVPITIKENVKNSKIEVEYNITWDDGRNNGGNMPFWFYGGKSGSSGGSEATAENGDVVVCTKSGTDYTPLPTYYVDGNNQEASSPAEFYLDENSDGKFYVLVSTTSKYDSAKSLTLEYLDSYYEVDESEGTFAEASEVSGTYTLNSKEYKVWEVTVPDGKKTGEHRLAFKFGDDLATYQTGNEEKSENFHTYFMWVLGNGYKPASYNEYTDGILVFDTDTAPYGTYEDLSELYKEYKADNYADWEISYNLSDSKDSQDNTFYVIYPSGTYLCENSYEQHTYELNGSSGWSNGRNYAGYFMQKIDDGAYTINRINRDVSTVTINDGYNSETYSVAKINLKNTHGNYKIYTEFYVTNAENNGKVVGGYSANILLMKGMNIIIQGANAVEQFNTGSEIIDVALGNSGEAQLKYVETGDNYVKYYLPNAAANISDQGTGRYLDFAIDLKDGYVIDNIKMESTKDSNETKSTVGFTYEKTTFYSPLDKNGDPIEDFTYIRNELGWAFSLAGNGDQMLIDTSHVVAASTPTYVKEKYQEAKIGDENLSDFINFRNEHPDLETVERLSYNDYSLILDDAPDSTNTRQLVFNVSKAVVGDEIAAKNSEGDQDTDFTATPDDSVDETVASELAGNLEVLEPTEDGEEYQVVKTYEMSTTANDGKIDGLYNITIPASELEGVDLENCKVVYYNSENVPMEMETTYTTDENGRVTGIVFTTGHFSNYAIVTTGEVKPNPTPSGGGGAAAAGTTDNVTNTAENKATDTPATTTATVKAETKTDSTGAKTTTATVDSTTANKIVTKAVENKSEEVVVDTSSKAAVTETAAGAKTEVSIPAETIAQISEKTEAEVVIKTDAAEVVLDEKTVEAVAEQAGTTGDVKLVVETVAQDDSKLEVELKLVSSNGNVTDFNGGNVSVTVKLGKTLAAKKLICVYIDDHGTYHKVSGQLNADGTYTFTTTHFSRYAIMAEEDVDKIIAEQNAKVEKMVGDLTLKARSSKTSKGNIKVKLITDSSDIKDLEDLGYTVKYKFYRSTKKSSGYSAKIEKDSKTYTNTTGKKGTRYYYKARVMVYDAQGNLIAKSALKQCKYATRKR